MKTIHLQYFAILKDKRGEARESLQTEANTPAQLYGELQSRYHFPLSVDRLRVAINEEFSDMETPLQDNDEIVYIPPVAGG